MKKQRKLLQKTLRDFMGLNNRFDKDCDILSQSFFIEERKCLDMRMSAYLGEFLRHIMKTYVVCKRVVS